MEFRGVFENGVVRPTEPVGLPEGTRVEFHPVASNGAPPVPRTPTPLGELERLSREVRANRSIEVILAEQGAKPIRSIDDLAGQWPGDEDDTEDFLRFLREILVTGAVLVDTDVFSFLVKRDSRAALYSGELDGAIITLSFMTAADLYAWAMQRRWSDRRIAGLQSMLAPHTLLAPDEETIRWWARIHCPSSRTTLAISPTSLS